MSESSTINNYGINFTSLLTILFIALKLMGYINWSWWWVLSPVWISAIITVLVIVVIIMVTLLCT